MTAETRCPCCGRSGEFDRPLVDLNTNVISFRGAEVRVRPMVAEFLSVVAHRHPEPARKTDVIAKLWGGSEPDSAESGVRLLAYQTRLATKGWPMTVIGSERGYRLDVR